MKLFLIFLLFVNVLSIILMFIDKQKAQNKSNRISENTLFFISFIGGSVGTIIGMILFNHKTSKWSFKLVIGLIVFVQTIAIYYLRNYLTR